MISVVKYYLFGRLEIPDGIIHGRRHAFCSILLHPAFWILVLDFAFFLLDFEFGKRRTDRRAILV
jgi:hypothetical protein